jgi:hypothetical protein
MEGFNVERAQTLSHVFHLVSAGGRACITPFLTLWLRYVGLAAGVQAGGVVGAQCMLGVLLGPLWLCCANACRKRRAVLVLSLAVSVLAALMLSFVPTSNPGGMEAYCNVTDTDTFDGNFNVSATQPATRPATSPDMTDAKPVSVPMVDSTDKTEPVASEIPKVTNATTVVTTTTTTLAPTTTTSTTTSSTTTSTTTLSSTSTSSFASNPSHHHTKPHVSNWDTLSPELQDLIKQAGYTKSDINKKDPEQFQALFEQMQALIDAESLEEESGDGERSNRHKRDILASTLTSINDKLAAWQMPLEYRTLAMVLVIILTAEILSAPVDTLADTLWFEFLDGLDFLERYGSQRVWSTLGLMVFPLIVTAVVEHTRCMLTASLHHFVLHFYFAAAVLSVAFALAFCFPIFNEKKKVVRRLSVFRGFGILFNDVHAFCYLVSVIILGACTAVTDSFLFWQVQDVGGSELYMGGAVSLAALSQFFFLAFSKLLIRKLSNPGCIVLALLVLSLRLVIYSFLWAPWVVLPTALLHGLSHTLVWVCIETYPDFKANPLIMDRSARAVIDSIHKGFAYGGGAIAGGFLYDVIGWATLLQSLALVALGWSLLFALLQRCVPHKHKVRYAKLLQAEEDQGTDDDEESVYDGDWLEIALKHDK